MTTLEMMRAANAETYEVVDGIYDTLLQSRTRDLPFWQGAARRAGGPFIEVGCGTGRILAAVREAGVEVVGIDRSPKMLARCDDRLKALGHDSYALICTDFEAIDALPVRPAIVAFTLGSLQYCLDRPDLLLKHYRSLVEPGCKIIVDAKNFLADRKFTTGLHGPSVGLPYDLSGEAAEMAVVEEVRFDALSQIVHERARYWVKVPQPATEIIINQYMRSFSLPELVTMIAGAGFTVDETLNGYAVDGVMPDGIGARLIVCGTAL